jgi:hypothetical protein
MEDTNSPEELGELYKKILIIHEDIKTLLLKIMEAQNEQQQR